MLYVGVFQMVQCFNRTFLVFNWYFLLVLNIFLGFSVLIFMHSIFFCVDIVLNPERKNINRR
jgi:hypothetical protein